MKAGRRSVQARRACSPAIPTSPETDELDLLNVNGLLQERKAK